VSGLSSASYPSGGRRGSNQVQCRGRTRHHRTPRRRADGGDG